MMRGVRCRNQKVMATHDSLLLCGACPCVEGCHYREYNTKRAWAGQMAILVSLLYGGGGEVWEPEGNGYTRLTTTLWSLSMFRGVSLSGIHQACVGWSDGYTRLIALWWGW